MTPIPSHGECVTSKILCSLYEFTTLGTPRKLGELCTRVTVAMKSKTYECEYCDSPGGLKTFQNQVSMPINGRVQCIDYCIHRIVAALNAGGVRTVGSCCGHKKMPGNILLEDGLVIVIFPSREAAKMCDNLESSGCNHSIENRSSWRPPRLDGTRENFPGT